MPAFKLIAITALKDCNQKFSKKIKIGHPYQFYQNYTVVLNGNMREVIKVTTPKKNQVPAHLYQLDSGIPLSISSVIGKNGTGKSTLMELLYQAIYLLAVNGDFYDQPLLDKPETDLKQQANHLKRILRGLCERSEYLRFSDYNFSMDIKPIISGPLNFNTYLHELIRIYKIEVKPDMLMQQKGFVKRVAARLKDQIEDLERWAAWEEERDKLFKTAFNVSILYEIGEQLMEVEFFSGKISYFSISTNANDKKIANTHRPKLEDFFYTISLNYSHHGLNSSVVGRWVNKLFHKNDAYRTPLVLNPMRNEGNFDINHEIRLSNERLMSTLVYDLFNGNNQLVLNKYKISAFIFRRKYPYLHSLSSVEDFETLPHASILKKKYKIKPSSIYLPHAQIALSYLSKKIGKVAEQYAFLIPQTNNPIQDLYDFLDGEESHIIKKIKQTVNYLSCDLAKLKAIWQENDTSEGTAITLSTGQMREYINLFNPAKDLGPAELVEFALPGFFNIDLEFNDLSENRIKLSEMSSGEQQMIFNSNAIMYHLYNIESVHKTKSLPRNAEKKQDRPAYPFVNIVLDEMELYYHPDMQRKFIFDLIAHLQHLKSDRIQGINVCILTHSPFILSDIPINNVLRLSEQGESQNDPDHQSFASNIHELLRKEFMLAKSFFGEYARQKIDQVIKSLRAHSILSKQGLSFTALDQQNIAEIEFVLQGSKSVNDIKLSQLLTENACRETISLVGEPVLYHSLMEFFAEVFPEQKNDFIDEQIARLKQLKKQKP